jgi:hypothetical protein
VKPTIHFWTHLAQFFLDRKILQTNVVGKLEAHILCSITFLWKSCLMWDNVIKYCRAGQDTVDNMAHAHCMLDSQGYKYTHWGCAILTAFPLPQRLHERTSLSRYTCIACLANTAVCHAVKKRCRRTVGQTEFRSGLKQSCSVLQNWQ